MIEIKLKYEKSVWRFKMTIFYRRTLTELPGEIPEKNDIKVHHNLKIYRTRLPNIACAVQHSDFSPFVLPFLEGRKKMTQAIRTVFPPE